MAIFGNIDIGHAQIEMHPIELPSVFFADQLGQGQRVVIARMIAKGFFGGIPDITAINKGDRPLVIRLQHLSPEITLVTEAKVTPLPWGDTTQLVLGLVIFFASWPSS